MVLKLGILVRATLREGYYHIPLFQVLRVYLVDLDGDGDEDIFFEDLYGNFYSIENVNGSIEGNEFLFNSQSEGLEFNASHDLFNLSSSGVLTSDVLLDYETNASSYNIFVQVKDEQNATAHKNFTVTLTDIYEDTDGDGFRDSLKPPRVVI